jgi:hypothetical protein
MVLGLFGLTNLKKYIPVFRRKAREVVKLFEAAIDENDGRITGKEPTHRSSVPLSWCCVKPLTFAPVMPIFSKLTLDIMGVFALGIELNSLEAPSVFEACYKEMFEQPLAGQLLIAINAYFPIRWLPIKINRDFLRAKETVRSQLRIVVKERISEMQEGQVSAKRQSATDADDLLTFLVREKYLKEEDGPRWTEDEMLEQVRFVLSI